MIENELAAKLRQAIQGCTLHNHGPVQAWSMVRDRHRNGEIEQNNVAQAAIDLCEARILTLRSEGVLDNDPRVVKEKVVAEFISMLFGVRESHD